ncbi:MAG: hypothetical protein NVS3B5_23480 [Sphingomicrobium sp.]
MIHSQLPDDGHERYTTRRVEFACPFTLGSAPEAYAAGAYTVETKEHALETAGHTAYVRTSTVLIISTAVGTCCREVRGTDLDDALVRDARHPFRLGPSENPDRGEADGACAVEVGL